MFAQIQTDIPDMSEISLLVISFLNKLELICLYTSIPTQLNGFNYCYLKLIILFNIDNLLADSEVVTSIAI